MSAYSRSGYRWTINEILSLQREFELLGLSIDEIAERHKRTPVAILYKLDQENFADVFNNNLYNKYFDIDKEEVDDLNLHLDNNDSGSESGSDSENDSAYDSDEEYLDGADDEQDEDDEEYEEDLVDRVERLEGGISEIKDMIRQMMKTVNNNKSCLSPAYV